jgi:hypothetical protein
MRYKVLAVAPLLAVLAFAAIALASGSARDEILDLENEVGKVLGLCGCLSAALAFERGDYLRRAWTTYGGCYVCLLVNDTLRHLTGGGLVLERGLLVLAGNASLVFGAWMLARAWTVAGLEHDEDTRRQRRQVFVVAALVSAGIAGWAIWHDTRNMMDGRMRALIDLASDMGDSAFLLVIAPVVQTAIALRGGVLRWPWGFLMLGGLAWAGYDTSSGLVDALHLNGALLVGSEALRGMASGYVFAAGLSQRWAVSPELTASRRL